MGCISNLLQTPETFADPSRVATELRRLQAMADPELGVSYTKKDSVQKVLKFASDPSGGTFTLTLNLRYLNLYPFPPITTAGIAHSASAATIETAIDTAITAAGISPWTNGHIVVTGGNLLAAGADVVLTYSGTTVDDTCQGLVTIDGSNLTGGSLASPATEITTHGQANRNALSLLDSWMIIVGTPPAQTADPAVFTADANKVRMKPWFIREMAQAAAYEDGNPATYEGLMLAMGQEDNAPLTVR